MADDRSDSARDRVPADANSGLLMGLLAALVLLLTAGGFLAYVWQQRRMAEQHDCSPNSWRGRRAAFQRIEAP